VPALSEQVLPSVWTLVYRLLVAHPGTSRDQAIELLTPRGLVSRTGGSSESRHVRPTIASLIDLGIVEDRAGGLTVADDIKSGDDLRREVTSRFLSLPRDEEDPWRLRSETEPEHHAQLAVAWLHLQGVNTPLVGYPAAEEALNRQLGDARKLLRNTAPYNTLERVAGWCGVAASMYGGPGRASALVPDPTEAFRLRLDDLVPAGEEVPARDVVSRLAEIFPWLPHGTVGRSVAQVLREVPDASDERGALSQGASIALMELEVDGSLQLIPGDDASDRVTLTLTGSETRAVARIRRGRVS